MDVVMGDLWGYLSLAWVLCNFAYAMFRARATMAVAYGIAIFAAIVIFLNIGGVLNADTWHMFGILIFGVEFICNYFKGPKHKAVLFGVLLFITLVLGW